MKKSLVALAVIAAAGAASAQSSVTLYGVADLWFGSKSVKQNGVKVYSNNNNSQTGLFDGGVSNSRWGLSGSEDLGGGLKANFLLEQGFSIDDGSATNGFNRTSWLGLSGGFGEVQLGQPWSAFDDVSAMASSVFDSDLAPINNVFVTTAAADSFNNSIKYISPDFGGLSGSVSYTFGEDKTAAASASKLYSFSLMYEAGPAAVGFGYLDAKSDVLGFGVADASATRLAATYDLGMAKLLASYGRGKASLGGFEGKVTEWEVGADVPLSEAMTLSVGYARSNSKQNAVKTDKDKSFGIAVAYSLSKRTTAYAGINSTTKDDIGTTLEKTRIYAVGLKHTF